MGHRAERVERSHASLSSEPIEHVVPLHFAELEHELFGSWSFIEFCPLLVIENGQDFFGEIGLEYVFGGLVTWGSQGLDPVPDISLPEIREHLHSRPARCHDIIAS